MFYLFAGQEDGVVVSGDDVDEVLGSNAAHVRNQQRTEIIIITCIIIIIIKK